MVESLTIDISVIKVRSRKPRLVLQKTDKLQRKLVGFSSVFPGVVGIHGVNVGEIVFREMNDFINEIKEIVDNPVG